MRAKNFLIEEQLLQEINMSPSALKAWAAGPEAKGMLMGIEFEMLVPGIDTDDLGYGRDGEPDYSEDERAESIDNVIDWFWRNDGLHTSKDKARSEMSEAYWEWLSDTMDSRWDDVIAGIRDWLKDNFYSFSEAMDDAAGWVDEEASEDEIREYAYKLQKAKIDQEIEDQGRDYERAYEDVRDEIESEYSPEEWLEHKDMSDMPRMFEDLFYWPYYGTSASETMDDLGYEFGEVVDAQVNTGSGYHDCVREKGKWCIEPDGSVHGRAGDGGLEFISPEQPIDKMLDDLDKVWRWANDKGCYTNKSCGLHMNISVPNQTKSKLDYVKMALFSGDEYVLKQFDRLGAYYAKNATQEIRDNLTPATVENVLKQMYVGMNTQASKLIHDGETEHRVSMNTEYKDNYVEFRSPGGDYLSKSPEELSMYALRYARALRIATDENMYKQEYHKKLYKLLVPNKKDDNTDIMSLFSAYSAGKLPRSALVAFVKYARASQGSKLASRGIKSRYAVYFNTNVNRGGLVDFYNASNKEEAIQMAAQKYDLNPSDLIAVPTRMPPPPTPPTEPNRDRIKFDITHPYTRDIETFAARNSREALAMAAQQWDVDSEEIPRITYHNPI